ncbi:HEAT repeat domain-containing protein [Kitasatospora sp. GAS1066B]|uniref:HEAT repeat domain-containing protein n=1 Tax=Kitasatospora sp. GAS1066B TaxID=3156271 RepID=UPI0035162FA4
MTPRTPDQNPASPVESWLSAALRDPRRAGYGTARSAIFDAVRTDRTGPVPDQLLTLTSNHSTDVRRAVLCLLTELSHEDPPWPAAAERAAAALRDRDPATRRAAAWLLAAADRPRAVRALSDDPSPLSSTARVALTEALFEPWKKPDHTDLLALATALHEDPDPAVRLRSALGVLRLGLSEKREFWESAACLDLEAGGAGIGRRGGLLDWRPGTLWGLGARNHTTQDACLTWVGRLAARPDAVSQQAAADMALIAIRHWRAAPTRVVPRLRPLLLSDREPAVRVTTATTIGASLEASRLCREELAALLRDPRAEKPAALALGRIGDARAVPVLTQLIHSGALGTEAGEAVEGLAAAGADLAPVIEAAQAALRRHGRDCADGSDPRLCSAAPTVSVLRACGAAAAPAVPELLEQLDRWSQDHYDPHAWLRTQLIVSLGEIGPAAASAVPLLDRLTAQPGPNQRTRDHAFLSLIRITQDRALAERSLDAVAENSRHLVQAVNLLEWLIDNGGLASTHAEYLWSRVREPRHLHPHLFGVLWKHAGQEAADPILATAPHYLGDDMFGPYTCALLTDLGPAAAPALPALREVIDRQVRLPMYIGDSDRELRADERITDAARQAHAHITSLAPCP